MKWSSSARVENVSIKKANWGLFIGSGRRCVFLNHNIYCVFINMYIYKDIDMRTKNIDMHVCA